MDPITAAIGLAGLTGGALLSRSMNKAPSITPPPVPTPPPAARTATLADAAGASKAKAAGAGAAALAGGTVGDMGAKGLTAPVSTANVTLLGGTS